MAAPRRTSGGTRRRLLVVLAVTLLCGVGAGLVAHVLTPVYSATARVVVAAGGPGEPAGQRAAAEQVYARTFAAALDGPPLAQRVLARTHAPLSPVQLLQRTTVSAVPGSAVVAVTVESSDARRAADLATAWALVAAADGPALTGIDDARLTPAGPAAVPTAPLRPRPLLWGGLAGAAAAVLALLLLAAGVPRRRVVADAAPPAVPERPGQRLPLLLGSRPSWLGVGALAGAVVLALVPELTGWPRVPGPPLVRGAVGMCGGALVGLALAVAALVVLDRRRRLVLGAADAVSAAGIGVAADVVVPRRPATDGPVLTASHLEPYRLLLEALGAQPEPEVLVVLGATAAAGTALRSIDVAVAAADAGRRTVLVGTAARGRRRSVAEVLAGEAGALPDAEALLLPTDRPGLRVLPLAWPAASDPVSMAALDSRRFSLLLDRIRADADLTVIAGPPLREGEVALRLAGLADGALLIAAAGRWTRESCRRTVALLQRTGCRVAGIVLVRRGRRTAVPTGWEVRRSRSRDDAPTPPDHPPAREAVPLRLVSDDDPAGQLARAVRAAGAGGGRARAVDGTAPSALPDRLAPAGAPSVARPTEHGG